MNKKELNKRGNKAKHIDSITLYAAMSRMDGHKSIQNTQGYEMLRQISYQMQEEAADGNQIDIKKLFE